MARFVVGIDLGTTHTVVASAAADGARAGAPAVFAIPQLVTATEREARPLLASCLYAPLAGEVTADAARDSGGTAWVAGSFARRRGGEVPGRFVASAKSWLGYAAVDRLAPVLPWGVAGAAGAAGAAAAAGAGGGAADDADEGPRISPVDASAHYLAHVRRAWDEAHPDAPLAEQEIVLTVPASFDDAARELTVLAATRAGLTVRLLEEPIAAFADWMHLAGDAGLAALLDAAGDGEGAAFVLVCDVGGGTTDLSLMRVGRDEAGAPAVARVAVGRHLLLGGDNMDLALAHAAEARMGLEGARLDPARFGQLVLACRAAKERLLAGDPPASVTVSVAGAGAQLVGGARSATFTPADVEELVLEAFLPVVAQGAPVAMPRAGLLGFGLPYERDVAITRHVAAFLARHAGATHGAKLRAVLLNGGVFRAARIAERVTRALEALTAGGVARLPNDDPDLAVARGAVAHALARRGIGRRIEAGSGRGYYVEVSGAEAERRAVCIVPRGARPGVVQVARDRPLDLVVGRPVRFELFASDDAVGHAVGDVVPLDDEHYERLPPIATTVPGAPGAAGSPALRVVLEGELTDVGTLDLACVEADSLDPRRFRLAFQLRESAKSTRPPSAAPDTSVPERRLAEARAAIDRVFGKGRGDVGRAAKDLVRDLEKILGERPTWTTPVARALFDAVVAGKSFRRRSADHERAFWLLAGYCLRPGFGDPLDPPRVRTLAKLFGERLAFPDQARGWQQFWITWRRVAAGLDDAEQVAIRDMVDPFLAPAEAGLKRPKNAKIDAAADMLDMAASLERVPSARRSALGGWLLERTWTDRDPRLWAAIARLGARVPAYASIDHVVPPAAVERWVEQLLRDKWEGLPGAAAAAVQMARVTGDRARDLGERVRNSVAKRLQAVGAPPEQVRRVRELVVASEAERETWFGEALPVGLRIVVP